VKVDLKAFYHLGLFRVSCKSFKDTANAHLGRLTDNLLNRVKDLLLETSGQFKTEYDPILSSLTNLPTTPEELTKTKKYLEKVVSAKADREAKMQIGNDRFLFLEDFRLSLEDDEFDFRFQTLSMPNKISALVDETDRQLSQIRMKLIRDLRSNQRRLENDTLAMSDG
jgi:hypothetical protein